MNLKSISGKTTLFIFFFAVILVIQFTTSYSKNTQLAEELDFVSTNALQKMEHAYTLQNAVGQVQNWLTDISATRGRDGLNDGFEIAEEYHVIFKETILKLKALDSENAAQYEKLVPLFDQYYATGEKMAQQYIEQGPAGGNPLMSSFDADAEKINESVGTFLSHEREGMRSVLAKEAEDAHFSVTLQWIFSLIYAGLLTVLIIGSRVILAKPLSNLSDIIQGLATRQAEGEDQSDGVDVSDLNTDQSTELGSIGHWLNDLLTKLKTQQQDSLQLANANLQIKNALDCAGANIMLADNDLNIIYMNDAVGEMMSGNQEHFRQDLPHFDASKLIGTNIDTFHKNPGHQRQLLASLTDTYEGSTVLGGRSLTITATPVFGADKTRLGTVVEWLDRTAEVQAQQEIDEVLQAASSGDLTKRISLEGKEGFIESLAVSLNSLQDTTEGVLNKTADLFKALSEGDLSKSIEGDYQGLFAQLQADSNATVVKLTEVIGQITNSARSVVTGADEIATGTDDLSQRTEAQASSLEETAASMEQMTSSVKQSAENAQSSANLAEEAGTVASQGGSVVSDAVKAMEEINKSSREIGDIIGVIDEIAFQTNLLALNAAVEAARAGDHGRGFAVVAGEVRNLAQRSASAAKDIKTLIGDSTRKVEEGAELVNKSGETLNKIVTSVQEVNAAIRGISDAAGEQSDGIAQVNIAVTQMDEMTQQNAALVEETSAASRTMSDQANQMLKLIQFFSIAGGTQQAVSAVAQSSPPLVASASSSQPAAAQVSAPTASPVSTSSPAAFNSGDDWAEF